MVKKSFQTFIVAVFTVIFSTISFAATCKAAEISPVKSGVASETAYVALTASEAEEFDTRFSFQLSWLLDDLRPTWKDASYDLIRTLPIILYVWGFRTQRQMIKKWLNNTEKEIEHRKKVPDSDLPLENSVFSRATSEQNDKHKIEVSQTYRANTATLEVHREKTQTSYDQSQFINSYAVAGGLGGLFTLHKFGFFGPRGSWIKKNVKHWFDPFLKTIQKQADLACQKNGALRAHSVIRWQPRFVEVTKRDPNIQYVWNDQPLDPSMTGPFFIFDNETLVCKRARVEL